VIRSWGDGSDAWRRSIPLTNFATLLVARCPGQRLLVKSGVMGAELDVLRGGLETLRRVPSSVSLVEVCLSENFQGGG
jgi:hypothetical protein